MAQKGCLVVCGDAGEALGDSIYEAHLYVRGERGRARLGLRGEGDARGARGRAVGAPGARRGRGRARPPTSGATARRAGSTTSTSTTRARTDARGPRPPRRPRRAARAMTEFDTLGKARDDVERRSASRGWRPGLREGAIFNRDVIHEIQRAAREGIYDIRGFGAKRPVPHFDDLLFLGASMSRYPLEGYRERCDTDVTLGARHAKKPIHLDIPITIAGMSFGALSGPAKEALGRGASRGRHLHDHRRRRHDRGGARGLEAARVPAAALALRDEPGRPASGGRDRDRRGPGREAGRRRDAARPEDLRPRGRDARPAEGDRPALGLPPPRLDRARTTSRSRSASCARSPTGRSRSTSRSARRGPTSTPRSR